MEKTENIIIYECFDKNGDPVKYVCNGHVDSMIFRDKCYEDFYFKPMIVRHQWQKTRRFPKPIVKAKKKIQRFITETVYCSNEERGAVPVTIGLMSIHSGELRV